MALVDIAATNQDNILNTKDIEELIHDDLNYRDKQLLRLKDEVLDLEDFSETVALSDFTLDDFRIDLSRYIESNRQALEDAPLGLYAVVPATNKLQAGVIFCLKQKGDTTGNENVNPLQPHYLIYMRDDGNVRFTFMQAKQILELFRSLCADRKTADEELCRRFDQQTGDGADMSVYSNLLEKTVAAIAHTFHKRNASNLVASRNGVLVNATKQKTPPLILNFSPGWSSSSSRMLAHQCRTTPHKSS